MRRSAVLYVTLLAAAVGSHTSQHATPSGQAARAARTAVRPPEATAFRRSEGRESADDSRRRLSKALSTGARSSIVIAVICVVAALCACAFGGAWWRSRWRALSNLPSRGSKSFWDPEQPVGEPRGPAPGSEYALPEDTTLRELVVFELTRGPPGNPESTPPRGSFDKGGPAGAAACKGWRPAMEDRHVVDSASVRGATALAVFDGHGGYEAAAIAAAEFSPRVGQLLADEVRRKRWTFEPEDSATRGEPEASEAMCAALREIDEKLAAKKHGFNECGATAVCVLVDDDTLTVAWLGDARAVLGTPTGAKALTRDHRPDDPSERDRIVRAEGYVYRGRVNGALAVSRALGDFSYKNQPTLAPEEQLVSNAPGVTSRNRAADDQFVVLVSDGVSEQVSDEALVALVRAALVGGDDAADAARRVLEWTLLVGGTDNATAVVQILDAKGLEAVDEAAVSTACAFADLPYPGCVRAGEALRLTSGDVERLDTVQLLELVDAMGLGAYRKIFAALDGVRLVNTPVKDLGLDVADKSYLEAALDWWKITQACRASSGIGAVGPETFDSQTL
mmetsp:Transcript_26311/g.80957  ORF Transcript_26311/g.80957 Transcript_26311/m.80957 type:complete len:565 (+) Transcript_26311:1007-2701(+)